MANIYIKTNFSRHKEERERERERERTVKDRQINRQILKEEDKT